MSGLFGQSELVDFGFNSYIDLRFFKIEYLTSILYLWVEFSGVASRGEVKRKVAEKFEEEIARCGNTFENEELSIKLIGVSEQCQNRRANFSRRNRKTENRSI